MNHILLHHFLTAYAARSIGQAATRLGLTQPALSKSLRKLEADLGVPLFERSTRGIVPTLYADTLARRGQAIQADVRNCVEELQHLRRGEAGEVKIGVAPALSPHFLPRVLGTLRAQHPSLHVTIHEGLYDDLAQDVARGLLDFALTSLPFKGLTPGLRAQELFRDQFVVCCGAKHPLAAQAHIPVAALLDWPWITPPREGMIWQKLVDLFGSAACPPPDASIETNSAALIKAMLAEGQFLSFMPRQLVLADVGRGDLIELKTPAITLERAIAVISRPGREHSSAAQKALDACTALARTLATT